MAKLKCNKCGTKINHNMRGNDLRAMGYKRRTNYPHGKKSKGMTTIFCRCGGIFIGVIVLNEKRL